MGVLNVGVLNVNCKPFTRLGVAESWECFTEYTTLCRGDLCQEYASAFHTTFNVDIFSFAQCVVGLTQPVSRFLSERIVP